jgi:uncharacterized OB-fold protein
MLTGLPGPLADLDTQPFWDGCNDRRLLLPRCADCTAYRWPPGPMCPQCQSQATEWVQWSGTGTVYSWVVVHHAAHPALADQVPYVAALVELEPGIRILGNILGVAPEEMRPDLALTLVFEDAGDGELIPNWEVAA